MRFICLSIVCGMMSSSLIGDAVAAVPWLSDIRQAQQIAHERQQLVLLHFYADWCGPCQRLSREVYPREDVTAAISQNYVPVKIDIQRSPEVARHYGVQSFPTDVFIEPSGRVVHQMTTPVDPGEYLHALNQLAAGRHMSHQTPYAQAPQQQHPQYVDPTARANPAPFADQQHGHFTNSRDQLPTHRGESHGADRHSWQPLTDPPGQPGNDSSEAEFKLALEGFCPVTLTVRETWEQGDPRWGAYHRGRTYLFVSPDLKQQFMADPDRYSPVLAGYDPTRFIDHGVAIEGQRKHGMWFRGQMYLFAEEASLERFQRSPDYYAQRSHEIMMRGRR